MDLLKLKDLFIGRTVGQSLLFMAAWAALNALGAGIPSAVLVTVIGAVGVKESVRRAREGA